MITEPLLLKLITMANKNKFNGVWVNRLGYCIGDMENRNDLRKSVLRITNAKLLELLQYIIPVDKMMYIDSYTRSKMGCLKKGDATFDITPNGLIISSDKPWLNSSKEVLADSISHKLKYQDDEIDDHIAIKCLRMIDDSFNVIDLSEFTTLKSHEFRDFIPKDNIFMRVSTTHMIGKLKNSDISLLYKQTTDTTVLASVNVKEKDYVSHTFMTYLTLN